jgi:hypothetical protein
MRPRQFAYRPRFYTPPEQSEGEKQRLHFETRYFKRAWTIQRQKKSPWVLVILLAIAVYLFIYFQDMAKRDRRVSGPMKVEDIEVIEVPTQTQ